MTYQDDYGVDFDIPRSIRREIEKEYIQKTYYWSVAISFFIIGFLIGVIV